MKCGPLKYDVNVAIGTKLLCTLNELCCSLTYPQRWFCYKMVSTIDNVHVEKIGGERAYPESEMKSGKVTSEQMILHS
jgi:hypothetical protein